MLRVLEEVSAVEGDSKEEQAFTEVVQEMKLFSNKANATLDTLIKADSNWFVGTFMKMIR